MIVQLTRRVEIILGPGREHGAGEGLIVRGKEVVAGLEEILVGGLHGERCHVDLRKPAVLERQSGRKGGWAAVEPSRGNPGARKGKRGSRDRGSWVMAARRKDASGEDARGHRQ